MEMSQGEPMKASPCKEFCSCTYSCEAKTKHNQKSIEFNHNVSLLETGKLVSTHRRIPLLILRHAYSSQPFGNASMYSFVSIVVLLRT
jgi:hypothetical protein